jgi:hypothetical protein
MNLVYKTKKLPVITAFILCMGAAHTAVADNQGGTRATDQGDSSNIANTMKGDERDINHNKNIKNGADAKKADTKKSNQAVRKSKQTRKSKTEANSRATAGAETDSSTIGKGTGTPETTTSGSGTGYSVPDK